VRQLRLVFWLQASDGRDIQALSQATFKGLAGLGMREDKMSILEIKVDYGLDTGIFLTDVIDL
jgi:hypothetical protein